MAAIWIGRLVLATAIDSFNTTETDEAIAAPPGVAAGLDRRNPLSKLLKNDLQLKVGCSILRGQNALQKTHKALQRLIAHPKPKDFLWKDLQVALRSLGFVEHERSGSRVCFICSETDQKIHLHKRHPDSTLLAYQINLVLGRLRSLGYIE